MSVGNRVYIIEGDSITPVAQERFDEFFFRAGPALRAYSGRTLTFAMPTYALENKRPARVVRRYGHQVTTELRLDPVRRAAMRRPLATVALMLVAIASAKWSDVDSLETLLGFEEVSYFVLFAWLGIAGPGPASLDHLVLRALRKGTPPSAYGA